MLKAKSKRKAVDNNLEDTSTTDTAKSKGNVDWLKFLEPKSSADLIVHHKKIEEIKNWLMLCQKSDDGRILLLTGPSGSSKLTTIKVLAKEADYDVTEFIVRQDVTMDLLREDGERNYNYKNQSDKFQEFLFKSSRFNSIFSQNDRLLIVKDIPNIFLRKGNEESFWKILKKFKNTATSSLVFIITDTNSKSLNIEFNLFPDIIRSQLRIDTISMNPISMTMMKKALKEICLIMKQNETQENGFVEPSQEVIDDIVAQSQGDIRNAIMNLQMVAQQGSVDISISAKPKANKKSGKTRKAPRDKINKGVGRDEILGIFHAVGRALHPKKEENEQTKQMKLTHNPDTIADCFSSQSGNYTELLHSNYLKSFSSIEDVREFTNIFSLSDNFQSEYRNAERLHHLSLNLIVRGAMVCNSSPSKGFRPITGYASKKFKNVEENCIHEYSTKAHKYNEGHRLSLRDYFLDYKCYLKLLENFRD